MTPMYDNTCKFLIETFPADVTHWLLGHPLSLSRLEPSELSLEPIRADSLILLQSPELIFHTEFQVDPDSTIPFRMADYFLRIYRRFPTQTTKQVVVYLRQSKSPLVYQTTFTAGEMRHGFTVLRIWEQPTDQFLAHPGLLPFAPLTRPEQAAKILATVTQKAHKIVNSRQRSNVIAASSILAGLVLEKRSIQSIVRSEEMRESVIYQSIEAAGIAQGIAQGKLEVALSMLDEGMNVDLIAKLTGLTLAQIEALQKKLP